MMWLNLCSTAQHESNLRPTQVNFNLKPNLVYHTHSLSLLPFVQLEPQKPN